MTLAVLILEFLSNFINYKEVIKILRNNNSLFQYNQLAPFLLILYTFFSLSNVFYLLVLFNFRLESIKDIEFPVQTIFNLLFFFTTSNTKAIWSSCATKKNATYYIFIILILVVAGIRKNFIDETLTILCFASFFLVLIAFQRYRQMLHNFSTIFWTGFAFSFYSILVISLLLTFTFTSTSIFIIGPGWGYGNFSNLIALYSAASLPRLILFLHRNRKKQALLYSLPIIVSIFIILNNQTRAAIITIIISFFCILITSVSKKINRGLIILFAASFILLSYFIYALKSESNQGRILVYKVCVDQYTTTKQLISGPGLNSFKADYGYKLKQYSDDGKLQETYADNVSNTSYAFNDYLQLTIELGLVSSLLIFLLIGSILYSTLKTLKQRKIDRQTFLCFLVPFLILACYHYPFRLPEFSFALIVLLIYFQVCVKRGNEKVLYESAGRFPFKVAAISVGCIYILYIVSYFSWNAEADNVSDFKSVERLDRKHRFWLKDNPQFWRSNAYMYSIFGDRKNSIEAWKNFSNIFLTSESSFNIGSWYYDKGDYSQAFYYLELATLLEPSNLMYESIFIEKLISLKKCSQAKKRVENVLKFKDRYLKREKNRSLLQEFLRIKDNFPCLSL